MAQKNRFYRVKPIGTVYKRSHPLREVHSGTIVQAIEGAPQGSLDVVDVKLANGRVKSVYSFQLVKPVKKPKTWEEVRDDAGGNKKK